MGVSGQKRNTSAWYEQETESQILSRKQVLKYNVLLWKYHTENIIRNLCSNNKFSKSYSKFLVLNVTESKFLVLKGSAPGKGTSKKKARWK